MEETNNVPVLETVDGVFQDEVIDSIDVLDEINESEIEGEEIAIEKEGGM